MITTHARGRRTDREIDIQMDEHHHNILMNALHSNKNIYTVTHEKVAVHL